VAVAGALAVHAGTYALVDTSKRHWEVWERHRQVFAEMLAEAPRLQPDTVVVLSGVPKEADPFGDTLWFDFGVRLAYPRQAVSGVYFLADGSPGLNQSLKITADGKRWKWDGSGMPPIVRETAAERAVFFEREGSGRLRLARKWPHWMAVSDEVRRTYDAGQVVMEGPATAISVNRYGLGGRLRAR